MKTCSYCDRPARSRGFCTMHYKRWKRGAQMDAPRHKVVIHVKEKPCSQCGETKRLEEFCRHNGKADGYSNWCKECKRKYNRYRRSDQSVRAPYGVDQVAQRWLLGFPASSRGKGSMVSDLPASTGARPGSSFSSSAR
jgi:hypothetical protein